MKKPIKGKYCTDDGLTWTEAKVIRRERKEALARAQRGREEIAVYGPGEGREDDLICVEWFAWKCLERLRELRERG